MKKALITGGSSGIGEAIALHIADDGNQVYVTGRNERRLNNVMQKIEEKGAIGHCKIADVRDPEKANSVVNDAINKMDGIKILVANAGVGRFKELEEFSDEDFDLQFDINVKGVFNYLRPTLKHMKSENEGQIIVTGSNLGFETSGRCGIYAATKHAVQAMVGAVREELRETNVKIATINPGSVDTPWFDGKDVNRDKMIHVNEVAEAALTIINQGSQSDIDHILIHPANR